MPVRPRFYYFTIFLRFYYFTILLFYYFTILLFYYFTNAKSGVCISKTHLCRLDPEFTTLLIARKIQKKLLLLSLLLIGFPPRPQQFASRIPTCAGSTQISLFYNFSNFLILREIGSLHLENPPVPVGPRIYHFTDFARNPETIPPSLFTFNRICSTASASAVCISKTHLCRFDPDFTISLFYYFTILLFYYLLFYYFTNLLILREIESSHLENPPVPVGPRIYHLHLENLLWHVGSQESLHLENLPWHVGPPICMSDRGIP